MEIFYNFGELSLEAKLLLKKYSELNKSAINLPSFLPVPPAVSSCATKTSIFRTSGPGAIGQKYYSRGRIPGLPSFMLDPHPSVAGN